MVFLEPELTDIHWETRHKKLAAPLDADARTGAPPEDGFHSRSLHYGRVFRHYGGFILCLVCYLLFLAYFLPSRDMFPDFWFWPTVLPVAPAAYILVLSVRNHKWLTREKFEKEWRRVQKEEQDAPFVSSHEGA